MKKTMLIAILFSLGIPATPCLVQAMEPEILYKDWAYLIGSPAKKFMKWVPVEVK